MSSDVVVEKYSNALFETSVSNNNADKIYSELSVISNIFMEKSVVDFFKNPFNSSENKIAVAKSALEGKVSVEVFNFVVTLVQNERIHLIAKISENFKHQLSKSNGEVHGLLICSQEPSADFKKQLEEKLSKQLNKKVFLKSQIDQGLVSGFKIQVDGWTLDDSAQNHLKKITEDLSKRGL